MFQLNPTVNLLTEAQGARDLEDIQSIANRMLVILGALKTRQHLLMQKIQECILQELAHYITPQRMGAYEN
jgi:hypothetical protein